LQHQLSQPISQKVAIVISVPFRLPNLATEFLGACNTASIAQRIPAGKVLSLLMPLRRNKGNLGFTAIFNTTFQVTGTRNNGTAFTFVLVRTSGEKRTGTVHTKFDN
jgi:hypothetical protein